MQTDLNKLKEFAGIVRDMRAIFRNEYSECLDAAIAEIEELREAKAAANEIFTIFLTEADKCDGLPITPENSERWTDYVTTVLKNCGFWDVSSFRK